MSGTEPIPLDVGRRVLRRVAAAALAVLSALVAGSPGAAEQDRAAMRVAGVEAPAWLELDADRRAIPPDADVAVGASVITGKDGGVRLELEDGAVIRLGPDTRLDIDHRDSGDQGTLYTTLVRGRLRYSGRVGVPAVPLTLVAGKVRVTLTGSDALVERPGAGADVLLLAGEVTVKTPSAPAERYSRPFTRYGWRPGQGMQRTELAPDAAQGEARALVLDEAEGTAAGKGEWVVNLMSVRERERARRMVTRLNEAGIPAGRSTFEREGVVWHRVQVTGFADEAAAREFAKSVRGRHGVRDTWVFER